MIQIAKAAGVNGGGMKMFKLIISKYFEFLLLKIDNPII
jgi:hypothetical protein